MTGYHKLHNEVGRWAIRIDGKEVYQVGDCASWKYQYSSSDFGKTDVQTTKGMHDRDDLLRSLKEYLSLSIDKSVGAPDVVIRSLAILDGRLGRRRLYSMNTRETDHPLMKLCMSLRLETEGMKTKIGMPNEDARPE
jgi:hypothetical protein